jgi:predicted Zn-dependent protease
MGHEAGHHIAGHLDKKKTQAAVAGIGGALLGATIVVLAAAAGAQPSQQDIENLINGGGALGVAGGSSAYSQTYELEADLIGAYVADRAGYDSQRGARVFARLGHGEDETPPAGTAAFWSTHPSSPERIAHVDAVAATIAAQRAAGITPAPTRKTAL